MSIGIGPDCNGTITVPTGWIASGTQQISWELTYKRDSWWTRYELDYKINSGSWVEVDSVVLDYDGENYSAGPFNITGLSAGDVVQTRVRHRQADDPDDSFWGDVYVGGDWWWVTSTPSFTVTPLPGNPSAVSPSNGASGVSISPTLDWTAGSNTQTNYVRHREQGGTWSSYINRGTSTSYSLSGLSANTAYEWQVKCENLNGDTEGSVWTFQTLDAPSAATNPDPADDATDIALSKTLSWDNGGGATSYDVWFGTDAGSMTKVSSGQAGTTYDPELSGGTEYFWRIDSINEAGTTTGTIWSFTTINTPAQVSNPSPEDEASDVPEDTDLSWSAASGAENYNVYWGLTASALSLVSEGQTETSYDPGTLEANKQYYWRVDSVNAAGATTGEVWTFSTGEIEAGTPQDKSYKKRLVLIAGNKVYYEKES